MVQELNPLRPKFSDRVHQQHRLVLGPIEAACLTFLVTHAGPPFDNSPVWLLPEGDVSEGHSSVPARTMPAGGRARRLGMAGPSGYVGRVRIFRFDPEVSIPIDQFGSDFRIGRLTGDDTQGRVQILHLARGGLVGRHRAGLPQLFAVVTGSGWVSGGDGQRRQIKTGQAAVWEPDEEHDVGSNDGLMAVCVEGSFEMRAVAVTEEIVVVDYDPRWPEWFERTRTYVWPAVKELALRIDHVGSTSVPGLAAKPIIDMDIVVAGVSRVRRVIDALRALRYRWVGDLGVEGREAFEASGQRRSAAPSPVPGRRVQQGTSGPCSAAEPAPGRSRSLPPVRRTEAGKRVPRARGYGCVRGGQGPLGRRAAHSSTRVDQGLEPASYWVPDMPDVNRE